MKATATPTFTEPEVVSIHEIGAGDVIWVDRHEAAITNVAESTVHGGHAKILSLANPFTGDAYPCRAFLYSRTRADTVTLVRRAPAVEGRDAA